MQAFNAQGAISCRRLLHALFGKRSARAEISSPRCSCDFRQRRSRRNFRPRADSPGKVSWCDILRPRLLPSRRFWGPQTSGCPAAGIDRSPTSLVRRVDVCVGAVGPLQPPMSPQPTSSRLGIKCCRLSCRSISQSLSHRDMIHASHSLGQALGIHHIPGHEQCPQFISRALSERTLKSSAKSCAATTSKPVKCVKSIYFVHQLRDAVRHVKYATD